MHDEPLIHSHITDVLNDEHPLAYEIVNCKICRAMLHCSNNECMTTWIEAGLGNYCLQCFAKSAREGWDIGEQWLPAHKDVCEETSHPENMPAHAIHEHDEPAEQQADRHSDRKPGE